MNRDLSSDRGRRGFLKKALLTAGISASLPSWLMAEGDKLTENLSSDKLDGSIVLFQGDSITDAGRIKENPSPNHPPSLGSGYASLAAAMLMARHPGEWQIHNRGISGNKVYQLSERWQEDCLDLKPSVLSILIGVNDFWHTKSHDYQGTVEVYKTDLEALIYRSLKALPNIKIIIGEPFIVEGGSAIGEKWPSEFAPYRTACLEVADAFDAEYIPYQKIFNKALEEAPASYWCPDGVHPSMAGNALMAFAWLKAFKKLL